MIRPRRAESTILYSILWNEILGVAVQLLSLESFMVVPTRNEEMLTRVLRQLIASDGQEGRFSGLFFQDYRPANLKKLEGGRFTKCLFVGIQGVYGSCDRCTVAYQLVSFVLFTYTIEFSQKDCGLSIQNCKVVCWVLCIARIRLLRLISSLYFERVREHRFFNSLFYS